MSFNRENVTFQTSDGKWNIGFWNFNETSSYTDENFDPEWDVEYTQDGFWFASVRHSTPEKAYEAYCRNHPNPAGTNIVHYEGNETECEQYAQHVLNMNSATRRTG